MNREQLSSHTSDINRSQRRRRTAASNWLVIVVYSLIAVGMLSPLTPKAMPYSGAKDIANHVSGIIEGRNALAEGQFPIRVAPHQNQNERYALFQFYGNLPYTFGGLLYLVTRGNPYLIWKVVVGIFIVVGAFYTHLMTYSLTCRRAPSIGSGALFITAPYLLTDIHGRFAFPEIVSFGMLPVVLYYTWRSFVGRRTLDIAYGAVAWSLLSLSHNITYFYASVFFGLLIATYTALNRKAIRRQLRCGACYASGILLTLWYLVPQLQLIPALRAGLASNPMGAAWVSPLGVLLSPSVTMYDHYGNLAIDNQQHFGIQIGWPIMIAVGLGMYYLHRTKSFSLIPRSLLIRLEVLYFVSIFMVWSPFDFWRILPLQFYFLQFPYRLLMFVVVFGSVFAAYALTNSMKGLDRAAFTAAVLLLLGVNASQYLLPHRPDSQISVDGEIKHPEMGRGGAGVIYAPGIQALIDDGLTHSDVNWVASETGGMIDPMQMNGGVCWAILPAPKSGDQLRLAGQIGPKAARLTLEVKVNDQSVAERDFPTGDFSWLVPLTETKGTAPVRIAVIGRVVEPKPSPATPDVLKYSKLQLEAREPDARSLVMATQIAPLMKWGHPTTVDLQLQQKSLVQLPVLYYPKGQRVTADGVSVTPTHLGRFVAIELGPGSHQVTTSFEGSTWANYASLIAWIAIGIVIVVSITSRSATRSRGTTA